MVISIVVKIPRKIVSGNNIYVQFFMKINNLLNEALSFCHEIERAHPITDSSYNSLFQNLEEKQRQQIEYDRHLI